MENPPPLQQRSPTPTNYPLAAARVIATPKKSHNIHKALDNALQQQSPSSRNVRRVLLAAGRALDRGNAQRALLKAEIARLQEDSKADKPRTRKRVREDPNNKFSSLESITEAQEASTRPPKRRRRKKSPDPEDKVEDRVQEVIHILHRFHEALEDH